MPPSEWRRRAERVIAETLAGLPRSASLREQRRALRAAYPFGPRQHHPYKVWCKAVRAALGLTAESKGGGPDLPPHAPCFALERAAGLSVSLRVDCGWCDGKVKGGCLVCLSHHREQAALLAWGQWPAWRQALVAGDALAGPVLADRLDDLGLTLLPPFFRALEAEHAETSADAT